MWEALLQQQYDQAQIWIDISLAIRDIDVIREH